MNQPQLIVMVGLPGSGKDYWINQFLKDSSEEWYVASTDGIIEAIAASKGKTYDDVFSAEVKGATRQMNSEVAQAIKDRKNIIWNQTNMAPGKRKNILSQFPREYIKKAVVVTVDRDIHDQRLKNRAQTTGKSIPGFVVNNMRDSYVEPSREEGFDEVIHVNNN
jgi:heterogeneous nuclear ribonucleoprotein U-like protein 1